MAKQASDIETNWIISLSKKQNGARLKLNVHTCLYNFEFFINTQFVVKK